MNPLLVVVLALTAGARRDLTSAIESHLAGELAAAEEGYRSVLERHPEFVPARMYLAETLWLRQERDEARRELARAAVEQPDLLALEWLGWHFGDEPGEDEAVLRRLENVYPFAQRRFLATGTASLILLSIGNVDLAVQDFRRASALDPDDVELHRRLGRAFFESGASLPAAEAFERVVAVEPADVRSWKQLGSSYLILQRWESSIAAFDQALDLDSEDVGVLLARGYAQERLADFDAALDGYRRASRLAPRASQPHFRMGRAFLALHELGRAEEALKKAARLDPSQAEPLVFLGETYLKKGAPERAVGPLRQATTLDPDLLDAHYHLAQAYRRTGRMAEARESIAAYERLRREQRGAPVERRQPRDRNRP